MSRRIGRRRLFSLNLQGQSAVDTSGPGAVNAIGSQTQTRDASLITTDFQIDFGNAAAPMSSSATVGTGTGAVEVIGSGLPSQGAQILQLSNTTHGFITNIELICVEAPTTGEDNIGVWRGDNVSGSATPMNSGNGTQMIAAANQVKGLVGAFEPDTDLGGKYVYLVSSGSTHGIYDAGKFILRVYGYPTFDDV